VTIFDAAFLIAILILGAMYLVLRGEKRSGTSRETRGRHSPKLWGWLGRADQLVKVKGMFLHPGQLQGVLKEFPEVKRYRAVATRDGNRDQVTLYIDTGAAPETAMVERLQQGLCEVLRIGVAVAAGADSRFPADGKVLADERVWD